MSAKEHVPVLLDEVISNLDLKDGSIAVDCTLGFAGHTIGLARSVGPKGRVLAIDQDQEAIRKAKEYLKEAGVAKTVTIVHDNFARLGEIAKEQGIEKADGALIDAGVSSHQLDEESRGFSYAGSGLDMRMDPLGQETTAEEILAQYSQGELERIFTEHADEPLARPIARRIVAERKDGPISAQSLVELIGKAYRRAYSKKSTTRPAAKVFLALRIEVNGELEALEEGMRQAIALLRPGGRLAAITFHSAEHRVAKRIWREESRDCLCPGELPVCVCAHLRQIRPLAKKPILPTPAEVARNPRARSAHLYVLEKL